MSAGMTIGHSAACVRIVAHTVPEEVEDSGKVRVGGAIRMDWLMLEILKMLSGLVHFLPGQGF